MQVERYYFLTRDDGLAGLCLLDALKASEDNRKGYALYNPNSWRNTC